MTGDTIKFTVVDNDGGDFKDVNTWIKTIAQLRSLKELELAYVTKGVLKNIHLLNEIEALYFVHYKTKGISNSFWLFSNEEFKK